MASSMQMFSPSVSYVQYVSTSRTCMRQSWVYSRIYRNLKSCMVWERGDLPTCDDLYLTSSCRSIEQVIIERLYRIDNLALAVLHWCYGLIMTLIIAVCMQHVSLMIAARISPIMPAMHVPSPFPGGHHASMTDRSLCISVPLFRAVLAQILKVTRATDSEIIMQGPITITIYFYSRTNFLYCWNN